jgi:hypothetical protein
MVVPEAGYVHSFVLISERQWCCYTHIKYYIFNENDMTVFLEIKWIMKYYIQMDYAVFYSNGL